MKRKHPVRLDISEFDPRKMTSHEVLAKLNSDPEYYKVLQEYSQSYIEIRPNGDLKIFPGNYDVKNFADHKEFLRFLETRAAELNRRGAMSADPPKVAEFFLLLIPIRRREHLLGDLEEEFRTVTVPRYGRKVASFLYIWQVAIELLRSTGSGLRTVAFGWIFSKLTK